MGSSAIRLASAFNDTYSIGTATAASRRERRLKVLIEFDYSLAFDSFGAVTALRFYLL